MIPPRHWPAEAIWETVESRLPGFSVEILPEVDSTNTELMRRARAGRIEPVLLVAERQTAGRGRLGKPWHSVPEGSRQDAAPPALTFSLGLPLAPADWSGLSLAVGLAAAQALDPRIRLKWPNDLWVEDRKLGGILIETAGIEGAGAAAARYLVVGIGLNIEPPQAGGLSVPPAALRELQPQASAASALLAIVPPLVATVQAFEAQGFAPFAAGYASRDLLAGRSVTLSDGSSGTARGVDASGGLLVHTEAGLRVVTSAEVSVRPVS